MAISSKTKIKKDKVPADKPKVLKTKVQEKVVVVHSCSQIKTLERQGILLERISAVTLGNGHPEDGLLFLFRKFMGEHDVVVKDISEIKDKLSTVNEINNELEIQRRVRDEKEKIVKEMNNNRDRQDTNYFKRKTIKWSSVGVIVGVISVILMLLFSILNYNLNKQTRIDTSIIKTEIKTKP